MSGPKTRPTDADVGAFLDSVPDARRRDEAKTVCRLMQEVTGEVPVMWGTGIVGFGNVRLRYASGRELDWPVVGFSPRKAATTVYLVDGFEQREDLLARLGPHSTGKSCLYLKRLADVDVEVLRALIAESAQHGADPAG
jgi:Domain of unknown function (DU1801)